jgi:hypothetical protein
MATGDYLRRTVDYLSDKKSSDSAFLKFQKVGPENIQNEWNSQDSGTDTGRNAARKKLPGVNGRGTMPKRQANGIPDDLKKPREPRKPPLS